ncbi:hypothetical protein ACFQ8T_10430 [Isoptericola sp. NPDC056618]|uniref:hypothetical protein n=1 Tax=Isoptericola sp. NPDC056618 TaxID=3345878 RepID=UPI00369E6BEA
MDTTLDPVLDTVPPQVLVGLATLTVIVLLRLRPRPARTGRLLIVPVVVMLVGAFLLVPWLALPSPGGAIATIAVLAVDLVLTVGLGVARGATVEVTTDPTGSVRFRYTGVTVALWAVSVALRFELADAGARVGASPGVTEGSILLALGLSLLVQHLVVVHAIGRARARRPQPLTEPSITPDTKNRCTNG